MTSNDLGKVLREYRRSKGWPLAEAAALSGVGIRFLSELERGKSTAALGKTLQVLQRFGLEIFVAQRGAK